jgi:hypothetical protein
MYCSRLLTQMGAVATVPNPLMCIFRLKFIRFALQTHSKFSVIMCLVETTIASF